jgi:predicted DCC family thiol-disulfide oxidoreductase YuxK
VTDEPESTPRSPEVPLLVFDGDCGFCRAWIARLRKVTGGEVDYAPFQEVAGRFPDIPLERFRAAVQLIEPRGHRSQGAEAVFRALSYSPHHDGPLWLYRHVPGFGWVSDLCYRFVARHRSALGRLTKGI